MRKLVILINLEMLKSKGRNLKCFFLMEGDLYILGKTKTQKFSSFHPLNEKWKIDFELTQFSV